MKNLPILGLITFITSSAFAEEAAEVAVEVVSGNNYKALAVGLAVGLAALGGTLGQGKLVSAAMEGIARNPQAAKAMFTPMMLGLAFVETLVIFALLLAFVL